MKSVSNRMKIIYLVILIIFISVFGLFWLDYIGIVDAGRFFKGYGPEAPSVVDASDDEPSLIAREEFEKEKQQLLERIEDLDKREALISEKEKQLDAEKEKIEETRRGLDLEKKKFDSERSMHAGYKKNVKKLADKMANMPPDESVKIMINWEDPLIIDVLRQMDTDAEAAGKASITAYLITLMPKEKASRIMYLMTQI